MSTDKRTPYEEYRRERLELQAKGQVPEWMTTGGYQLFKQKYQYEGQTVRETHERIADTLSAHLPASIREEGKAWFFSLLWKGWLSPSTPVLANTGTNRGLPVSCSGQYIGDSIHSFYSNRLECAVLTKNGFGTSGYFGDIRPRGAGFSGGGTASGAPTIFAGFCQDMRDVSQGSQRRGAFAAYFDITTADFEELITYAYTNPDDCNIGWCVTDSFITALDNGDAEALRRFQETLKLKMTLGIGYYFFVDIVNNLNPEGYPHVNASNLCSEITLFADNEHTFTCVLSSMNVAKFNEWKDTDAVFWSTVFLDCVAEEFIQKAKHIPALEKAVRYTEKYRSLGLGVTGFCTYLQSESIPYESLEAQWFNDDLFSIIKRAAVDASKTMEQWGRVPHSHLLAVAPTKSTALLMGGVSEGINPDPAMTYTQLTPAGEVDRVSPVLLKVMKERGKYTPETIQDIVTNNGSVQHVEWLDDHEKKVFKTAFEINQETVVRLASRRQRFICQSQSLNLFFAADEDPRWISHIHKLAFKDKNIKSLYYIYTKAGISGSKECEACQ